MTDPDPDDAPQDDHERRYEAFGAPYPYELREGVEEAPDGFPTEEERNWIALPLTSFMYTLDQIAYLLNVKPSAIGNYVRFRGAGRRDPNPDKDKMVAVPLRTIEDQVHAEWRVAESEFIRFCRDHNLVIYSLQMGL